MYKSLCIVLSSLLVGCTETVTVSKQLAELPVIVPDYKEVTIPAAIAPLNFEVKEAKGDVQVRFASATDSFEVAASKGRVEIPSGKWEALLASATGKSITVRVFEKQSEGWVGYAPYTMQVAPEPIDPYIVYRLIEPGYELWNKMGIYQRELATYSESAIYENKMTDNNCVNCHSFCMQNPEKMLFHMRATYPGTMIVDGGKIEKLNTKTPETISPLVYPSWHPSGKYVAFSVNKTQQSFHSNSRNRIEVYDLESDVVVYDVEKHEIVTSSRLSGRDAFETFPTFSPDGKSLYYCSAEAKEMPASFEEVKYSLCRVDFDPESRSFGGQTDTLYNAAVNGKSVSFPRVSPDGKYLLYTLASFGNFSIWHADADLYMVNLQTGTHEPLTEANSPDVESYHSWSSNSKWIVFSSRRMDGLYTRPYIAYIDAQGKASKPFVLPQKSADFYLDFMKSYNIPEFVTGKVKQQSREIALHAKNDKGTDVKFSK